MQVITKLTNERIFAAWTRQEPSIGRQRIEGAKESKALNECHMSEASTGTMRSVLSLPSGT